MNDTTDHDRYKWRDDFLLGYDPLDDNHREFVDCVAGVLQAPDDGVGEAFDRLRDHLANHFAIEDQWMNETAFPPKQCHMDEHAAVLRSAAEVEQMLRNEGNTQNCRRFAEALMKWFPGHADLLDSALAHWMCKRVHGGKPVVLRRKISPMPTPDGWSD